MLAVAAWGYRRASWEETGTFMKTGMEDDYHRIESLGDRSVGFYNPPSLLTSP